MQMNQSDFKSVISCVHLGKFPIRGMFLCWFRDLKSVYIFLKKARLTAHSYLEHSQIDFLKKWPHKLGKVGLIALWILLNITELHHESTLS